MPIGEACLVSNSDITCLHPPHGAIGVSLILDIDPATMAEHQSLRGILLALVLRLPEIESRVHMLVSRASVAFFQ